MNIQIKKNSDTYYVYIGDAIYLTDRKNLAIIKKNIANGKKIIELIESGDIKVYSLWNLIYYDIVFIGKKSRRSINK